MINFVVSKKKCIFAKKCEQYEISSIGIQTFDKIIDGGYVYVDKTALVYKMAHSS